MKTDLAALETRLQRLERTNRLLLLIGACTLIIGAAVSTRQPEVIQASAVQLLDPAGQVVAELAIRDRNPGLYLTDAKGKTRLALEVAHTVADRRSIHLRISGATDRGHYAFSLSSGPITWPRNP